MKTMTIEKILRLEPPADRVERVTVSQGLQYKKEDDGIRAIGPLYVNGTYRDREGSERVLRELIDMDVFAGNDKLTDSDFYIQIGEVSSDVVEYQLKLDIELQIFGLKEERLTANPSPAASEGKYEESGVESEDLTAEENNTDALQILDDCFEDLFEDEETGYTTCRLIVAKAGDTYGSIAQRYGVDEKQLRERNQEKEVNAKMLVMLP